MFKQRNSRRIMKLELAEPRQMLAADFELVTDLNTVTQAYRSRSPVVQVGSIGFFTAHTPATGVALFRTNGTASGTFMVKDPSPGADDLHIEELTNVGGVLYFSASNSDHGRELWKSNGTSAGTTIVKDIELGESGSYPKYLTNVNGTLFFSAGQGNSTQLWKSNGTEAGTLLVKPTSQNLAAYDPKYLANANGVLYFSATNSTSGRELWKSDGTAAGTKMVAELAPGMNGVQPRNSNPARFTNAAGFVYFTDQSDLSDSSSLWKTDGTNAGTEKVFTILSKNQLSELTNFNDQLFYILSGSLRKIGSGSMVAFTALDEVRYLTNVSGTLYFRASNPTLTGTNYGIELWKTDGTALGTTLVRDLLPGPGNSFPNFLTNVNGTLYFKANDSLSVGSIWKTTNTAEGAVLVRTGIPDVPSFNFSNVGSTFYFTTKDTNFEDMHLWKSDGTAAGTTPVRPLTSAGSNPTAMVNLNGKVVLAATKGEWGTELWSTDGTSMDLLADIVDGPASSNPSLLTNANGTVYFTAYQPATGIELWQTDGTFAGTRLAADVRRGLVGSAPTQLVNIGDTIYFTADNGTNGRELWRLGARGVELVKDIRPGTSSSGITGLTVVGKTLYFQANDGTNGPELWKSDGTAVGTSMVKNIRSGVLGSAPDNFAALGSVIYFQANDGTNGRELWRSNGTSAGTVMVKNIHNRGAGIGSYPASLTAVNNLLYFSASDGTTGRELWKSDGTAAGTVRVRDIFAGTGSSYPSSLTNVNGKLYFTGIDSLNDGELWASDGTAAGTLRVRNISPSSSSFPVELTNVNGLLYFAADDSVNGNELYRSDGTALGTKRIASFIPGFFGGNPKFITTVGSQVFLSADDGLHGRELFVQNILQGTDADDVFTVKVSQTGDQVTVSHAASLVQVPELYGTFSKSQVLNFVGHAGNDSLRIEGNAGADLFIIDDKGISTNGALLTTDGFEALTLAGKAGDDTYRFDADVVQATTFRLDESEGGIDTVDLSPSDSLVQLNLTFSIPQNVNGNLVLNLASSTSFENIIGGNGPDVLIGNALDNTLEGGPGNDTLVGAIGNDTLIGHAGDDLLNGDLGNDLMQGGLGNDRYLLSVATIEEQDQLVELLDEGSDTIDFNRLPVAVSLNLGLNTAQAVHSGRILQLSAVDTFENAIGGAVGDLLIGSAVANTLNGGGGNDDLRGGLGDDVYVFESAATLEADVITELANAGLDTISFASMDIPITLNMATTSVQAVHTNRTLRLTSAVTFENAVGGTSNDTLAGNGLANVLIGNGGNDQLNGLGKRDLLIGGLGADILNGGDDEDIMIAGRTLHDAIFANVNTLLSNWTAATSQVERITLLRAGVGTPSVALLKQVDVLDDGGDLDSLTGAGSLDWFFRAIDDLVTDLNGEVIDET